MNSGNIYQQEIGERLLNKIPRMFLAQMETFKRYRSNGEAIVTVQNVSVQNGGQAIVGHVSQRPREVESDKGSPQAITDARTAPMDIDKQVQVLLPSTGKSDT
jgi:hypothetical protein